MPPLSRKWKLRKFLARLRFFQTLWSTRSRLRLRKLIRKRPHFPTNFFTKLRTKDNEWDDDKEVVRSFAYSYYPNDRRGQRKLNRLPLKAKKRLILPIPETQFADECLVHAVIKCLEARLRLKRWKANPRHDTPRLSISRGTDLLEPFRNWETVYDFLGVPYVKEIIPLGEDEKGVTTA